jgi:hypothetical protein
MTSNLNDPKIPEKKIYSEGRGIYSLVDGNKVFRFEFPIGSLLEDNLAAISFIKEKLLEAIQQKDQLAKEQAEKELADKEKLDDVIEEAKKVAQP